MLVCNAALRQHKPVWEIDYEEWHQVFAVNLHSTFYLVKAVISAASSSWAAWHR